MDLENQPTLPGFEPDGDTRQSGRAEDAAEAGHEPAAGDNETTHDAGHMPDDEEVNSSTATVRMDSVHDRRTVAMATPGWRYPISDYAFWVRPMTDEQFSDLVEDILKNGLLLPITRWRGEIIDGTHRLLACLEAGIEPRFEDLDDDADPESHIESKNDRRRHLTPGERAEDAARRSARSKRGRPRTPAGTGGKSAKLRNKRGSMTQEEAASHVSISPRTVSHGVRVFSEDSPAIPVLRQAVREKKIAVSDASKVVHEPSEIQRRAVDLVDSGEVLTVVDGVRRARLESPYRQSLEDGQAHPPACVGENIRIHNAKIADLHGVVEPATVGLIICCPPRDARLPVFSDIAAFSAHALAEDGLLIVAADTGRLPEQLGRLKHRDLEWICQVHLLFDDPIANTGEPHYIELKTVPLLLFGKQGTRIERGDDVINVPSLPEATKDVRDGSRSLDAAAELIVGRFASSDQVLCDPMLNGRIGIAVAAAKTGCIFVGADVDPSRIERIAQQLSESIGEFRPDDQESP